MVLMPNYALTLASRIRIKVRINPLTLPNWDQINRTLLAKHAFEYVDI